jgi:hypothetical protein
MKFSVIGPHRVLLIIGGLDENRLRQGLTFHVVRNEIIKLHILVYCATVGHFFKVKNAMAKILYCATGYTICNLRTALF